jgi:hypothetical protein
MLDPVTNILLEAAMTRLLFGFAIGLSLNTLFAGQGTSTENAQEYSFSQGGAVRLQLSSGDYTIRAASSDRLVVRWQAEAPEFQRDMKKIRVQTDISGHVATIRTGGPTKHARITIDVPARSDLHLRVRAGDVRISGIEGNKDIHMTAGDLKIDMTPTSYSYVHASVTIGDLRATALGISKDGIRNSFDWNGTGKYTLEASLFAGDLTLARMPSINRSYRQSP